MAENDFYCTHVYEVFFLACIKQGGGAFLSRFQHMIRHDLELKELMMITVQVDVKDISRFVAGNIDTHFPFSRRVIFYVELSTFL